MHTSTIKEITMSSDLILLASALIVCGLLGITLAVAQEVITAPD